MNQGSTHILNMSFFVFLTYASAYHSFWSVFPEMVCRPPGVCQCHDLPLPIPKVLRILCATSRAVQHYHAISLARWPIEVNSIPKLHVADAIEHLGCFFNRPRGLRSEALACHGAYAAFSSCCTSPHDASCLPTPHLPSISSCHICRMPRLYCLTARLIYYNDSP